MVKLASPLQFRGLQHLGNVLKIKLQTAAHLTKDLEPAQEEEAAASVR